MATQNLASAMAAWNRTKIYPISTGPPVSQPPFAAISNGLWELPWELPWDLPFAPAPSRPWFSIMSSRGSSRGSGSGSSKGSEGSKHSKGTHVSESFFFPFFFYFYFSSLILLLRHWYIIGFYLDMTELGAKGSEGK